MASQDLRSVSSDLNGATFELVQIEDSMVNASLFAVCISTCIVVAIFIHACIKIACWRRYTTRHFYDTDNPLGHFSMPSFRDYQNTSNLELLSEPLLDKKDTEELSYDKVSDFTI